MKNLFARFVREESGQDLIEYSLLAAIVALGAVVGMTTLASGINTEFGTVATKLQSAS
jgi:pilus assembly protein Flp/PilA